MKKINLFNKEILVSDYLCSSTPEKKLKAQPSLRLYIKVNDECNAKCKFCVNEKSCDYGKLDFSKLEYIIRYLNNNDILHGISITGGEPMLNPEKINMLINLIYSINPKIEVQINTNGINILKFLEFDHINDLESIHISRHHYDDEVNFEIFNSRNVATAYNISLLQEKLIDKRIININTLVMKNYINNLKEIKKMLNHVGEMNVYKNGFVSLIKCNNYSMKQFINFNEIFNNLDSNFYLGHHFYQGCACECLDGMYITDNNKLVEFYARMVKNGECAYTTQLVYTSDNKVTDGFTKRVLYK